MKLIDADKLIEKLSAGLDNPEELPVISIGTVMRMIDSEEEIHTSQPESPCYLGSPCEYQNPDAEIAKLSQEGTTKDATSDLISRQAAIDALDCINGVGEVLRALPPAQPEYEPVTAEDLAKTMSVTTAYSFMAWYGTVLALMEGYGFAICKKTM